MLLKPKWLRNTGCISRINFNLRFSANLLTFESKPVRKAFSLIIFLSIPLLTIGEEQDITLVQQTEQFIFEGRFDLAEENILAFVSENNTSDTSKAQLYTMAGEIKKLSGDMEHALIYWEKSNAIRSSIYPKG